MDYEPFDDAQLEAWRELLEQFADDSDLDRQLIDLLVTVKAEPIDSPRRNKAISRVFTILDRSGGLFWSYSTRDLKRGQIEIDQQQSELDESSISSSDNLDKAKKKLLDEERAEFDSRLAQLSDKQSRVLNWLHQNIHKFDPSRKDKNGNFIGHNLQNKLCRMINFINSRQIRGEVGKENKRKKELTLGSSIDGRDLNTLLDTIPNLALGELLLVPLKPFEKNFRSLDDLDNWKKESEDEQLASRFWKYLDEDPNNQLKNYEYQSKLNYHKFAQRLYQIFTLLLKENGGDTDSNVSGKMAERVIMSIVEQVAEEFGISTAAALKSKYDRNFKRFVAGLWIDMIIDNEEYLEVLMAAIAKDKLKLLQEVYYKSYQDVNVQYLTKQGALRYKTPLDFNSIAAELKRQGMKPRDATAPMIFDFWQKRAKPAIANLVIKEKLFGSLGL